MVDRSSVPVRVLVAHDRPLVRDLLCQVLCENGIHVLGDAASLPALLAAVRRETPDVVVTDSSLADAGVTATVTTLVASGAGVLVLSEDDRQGTITAMLLRGASGYLLLAQATPGHVVDAIRSVSGGHAALNPAVAAAVLDQWRRNREDDAPAAGTGAPLTPREREVLGAMAEGLAAKAIARRLGLAVKTVENHKARVFEKLGAKNQANAIARAAAMGLIGDLGEAG